MSNENEVRAIESTASMRMAKLLNLFYGLAITTGFGASFKDLIIKPSRLTSTYFLLLLAAFLIAIVDWVIYHFISAPFQYKSILRLILDLIFPIWLFSIALFYKYPRSFFILLFGYFVLSAIYAYIAKPDLGHIPKFNVILGARSAFFSLASMFVLKISNLFFASIFFLAACSLPWACIWFNWLNNILVKHAFKKSN